MKERLHTFNVAIQCHLQPEQDADTLLIVRWIVYYPKTVASISMLICVLISIWALCLPYEIDKRTSGFRVMNNIITLNYDAFREAPGHSHQLMATTTTTTTTATPTTTLKRAAPGGGGIYNASLQSIKLSELQLLFVSPHKNEDFNVFTQSHLNRIKEVENIIKNTNGYEDFCLKELKKTNLTIDGEIQLPPDQWKLQCANPISLTNFFFPTRNNSDRKYEFHDVADFNGIGPIYDIPSVTNMFVYYPEIRMMLDRRFTIWFQRSRVAYTSFQFGWPMKGFSSISDRTLKQTEIFKNWILKFHEILPPLTNSEIQVVYEESTLTEWEIDRIIFYDITFAVFSVVFVFLWLIIHTKSVLLSVAGLLHILVSIPSGYFVIRVLLGDPEVNVLMCMVFFIILGIGCDDIFIFVDAWRQSFLPTSLPSDTSLVKQVDWTYRRSFATMFITSITTAASFWTNATSPMIPIQVFGIFIGCIVMINFFLVVTWFPAILILWYKHCDSKFNCLPCCKPVFPVFQDTIAAQAIPRDKESSDEPLQSLPTPRISRAQLIFKQDLSYSVSSHSSSSPSPPHTPHTSSLPPPAPAPPPVPPPFPSPPPFASSSPPPLSLPLSPPPSPSSQSSESSLSSTPRTDDELNQELYHEHDDEHQQELEDEHEHEHEHEREHGFGHRRHHHHDDDDDDYHLSNGHGHLQGYNLFETFLVTKHVPFIHYIRFFVIFLSLVFLAGGIYSILNLKLEQNGPQFFKQGHNIEQLSYAWDNILPQSNNQLIHIIFGIASFDRRGNNRFDTSAKGTPLWKGGFDISSPAAQTHLVETFEKFMTARNHDILLARQRATFRHCFMCGFKDWLIERKKTFPVQDSDQFWKDFKEYIKKDGSVYASDLGWTEGNYDNQVLLYCSMYFEIYTDLNSVSLSETEDIYNNFNEIITSQNSKSPPEVSGAFITDGVFVDMITKKTLLTTALFGVFSSLLVAVIVLIIATMNIILSIYAIFCIILILMILTSYLYITSSTFGILESVAFTIVVGLSVDYVVHLGVAYMNQLKQSKGKEGGGNGGHRITLLKGSVAEIGSAILGGAITTATSVLMLFFCQITFFTKFGQFVFMNIVASFFVTFTVFLAILLIMGPRGNMGDIKYLLNTLLNRRKEEEEQELEEGHYEEQEDEEEDEDNAQGDDVAERDVVLVEPEVKQEDSVTASGEEMEHVKLMEEPDVTHLVL